MIKTRRVKELEAQLEQAHRKYQNLVREAEGLRTVQAQQLAQLQDADDQLLALQQELDAALEGAARVEKARKKAPPWPEGLQYVLVTMAQNDNRVVKHAWGPFPTRGKAQSLQQKFKRNSAREGYWLETMILKVLDDDEVKNP